MTSELEHLLMQLIDIPSPSGEELAVASFVYQIVSEMPFDTVKKIAVDSQGFVIVATKGSPKVALEAHLDVVKPHIKSSIDQDNIYGRGSCDTKGSVAAMLMAAKQALADKIDDFALFFSIREETNFAGIKTLVQALPSVPFTIVGEPTMLKAISSHYGLLSLVIEAEGKAAHTSQADEGINAIDILLESINSIQKEIKIYSESSMTLVKIEGGKASNVVPDFASAKFSFRLAPADHLNYFELFSSLLKSFPRVRVNKTFDMPPVKAKLPVALSFLEKAKTAKYFTELSMLQDGLILGPGDISVAHSAREFVSRDQLKKAVILYVEILKQLSNFA